MPFSRFLRTGALFLFEVWSIVLFMELELALLEVDKLGKLVINEWINN